MDFFVLVSRQHEIWPQQLTVMIKSCPIPINSALFFLSWKSIYSLQPSWWKQDSFVFLFKLFATFAKVCFKLTRQFDEGDTEWGRQTFFFFSARRQRCTSDALINIYECVFDAAFKVPSTQHLTTASLYRTRPSPRSPVLKQSIIKEQISAITLSDSNGISSGTLKARHFPLQPTCWEMFISHLESGEVIFLHHQLPCCTPEQNKVLGLLSVALMSIWCWNENGKQD